MFRRNRRTSRRRELTKDRDFTKFGLWTAILYTTIFNLTAILIGIVLILFNKYPFLDDSTMISSSELYFNLGLNALAITLMAIFVTLFNRKIIFIRSDNQFSLSRKDWKIIGLAMMVIFAVVGLIQIIPEFFRIRFFSESVIETPYDFFSSDYLGVIIFATFVVSFISPIAEEFFFRWSLMSTLRHGFKRNSTILFSAMIFSLAHSTTDLNYSFYYFIIHFLSTFVIGLVLGYVYLKLRKILATILLHGFWNLFASTSGFFDYANIGNVFNIIFYVIVGCCVVGTIYFGIMFLRKKRKIEQKQEEEQDQNEEDQATELLEEWGLVKKRKINFRWEWFELVIGYFLLIGIIPVLLELSTNFAVFLQGYLVPLYFLILTIYGFLRLLRLYSERLIFHFPGQFEESSTVKTIIETKKEMENDPQ